MGDIVDISTERIQNILHEKFCKSKLSARWMRCLLTMEQKRNRMTTSEHCLDMFKGNPKEFLRRFETVDESWIHHYTPEMKNSQNSGRHGHRFWDSQGIIFTDYLEKGRTITGQYYADLLGRFEAELVEKNGLIWQRKKCSFSMTQQNWSNYVTNCCLIHPILQIWHHAILFCSQT